ncbi:MAG: class I SAM-dependent methyltransferase [Pirellulales bacterium]
MPSLLAAERSLADVFQPGQVVCQSHPDHLASIARLFSVETVAVDRCRVLEVGCGAGLNLLPMAERHPDSTFVGLDRSPAAVTTARQLAASVELHNIAFHELLLESADDRQGTFDYIICHDVYPRLPLALQDQLMAFCRAHLNPRGLLYLSCRALPGWIVPSVAGDLARSAVSEQDTLPQRVARARQALRFFTESIPSDGKGWARLLRGEASLALGLSDAALAHEHLVAESHPVLLHELAGQAAAHGLQYLGDADIHTMFAASLGPAAEHNLAQMARDSVSLEQYMDLLCNRSLHRSLFCHRDVHRTYQWTPDRLRGLFLAGNLQAADPPVDLLAAEPARFAAADGRVFGAALPAAKAALELLASLWPRAISCEALLAAVEDRLHRAGPAAPPFDEAQRDEMARNLIECMVNGLIEVHSDADRFTADVSQRPHASRWARVEAESRNQVTNLRHEPVVLDEMSHNLLRFLDGQRNRSDLLTLLVEATERGQLSILRSDLPAGSGAAAAEILEQVLDQALAKLAGHSLLIA